MMTYIRLKTNIKEQCIQDRLQYEPEIIELHLEQSDLTEETALRRTIRLLQDRGTRVYLHQPPKRDGVFWDIMAAEEDLYEAYLDTSRRLARICKEEQVRSVIHAHYLAQPDAPQHQLTADNSRLMRERIARVLDFAGDVFLWEDTIRGLFSYANPLLLEEVVRPLNLPLNVDVSHAFIALRGDNAKLKEVLSATRPFAEYYHLVDSMGLVHDSLPLGQGRIDWAMVAPFVAAKDFIFEINLAGDHSDCTPMVESAAYFREIVAAASR